MAATPGIGAVDREQLIRLVEGARSDVEDFAFEYEGDLSYHRPRDLEPHPARPEGVQQTYTGTFIRRRDGATLVEIYSVDQGSKIAQHAIGATLRGTTETSVRGSDQAKASVTIHRGNSEHFRGTGNYGRLFLSDVLLDLARSRLVYEFEGVRKLDGADCLVVRFRHTEDPATANAQTVSQVFWVDLQRGGHVLRHEMRWGEDLAELTTGIRLQSFRAPSGKIVWLPVSGQVEGRVTIDPTIRTNPRIFTTEPVFIEKYHLLQSSLRMEQGIPDARFSVKARPGDAVSDEIRKARYEFGQYLVRTRKEAEEEPITDAEIRANLDRMLSDSAVLARELKASSVLRRGTPWTSLAPWIIAGTTSAALVVLLIHRHRAP